MATGLITIPSTEVTTVLMDETLGKPMQRAHGSGFISPYLFGGPRGQLSTITNGFARIHKDNFTAEAYEWSAVPKTTGGTGLFEGGVVTRGKWYTAGAAFDGFPYIFEWSPTESLPVNVGGSFPSFKDVILSDGDFLYLSRDLGTSFRVWKVDLDTFDASFIEDESGNSDLLLGADPELSKTGMKTHSGISDGNFLYFSRFYQKEGGRGTFVKINKQTGVIDSWVHIPTTTDDMTHDDDFFYLGIEVSDSAHYGYGWGALAIRKADLQLFPLPALHATDTAATVSFASLIFGDFLLDAKTNSKIYIINKSNPESWSLTANVDDIVLDVVTLEHGLEDDVRNTWTLNEMHLDSSGTFYGWLWPLNQFNSFPFSAAIKFTIPGYDFSGAPNVTTRAVVEDQVNKIVTLRGETTGNTGGSISDQGFYFDTGYPPTTQISLGPAAGIGTFETATSYDPDIPNYVRAYATNTKGEGLGNIVAFGSGVGILSGIVTLNKTPVENATVILIRSDVDQVQSTTTTNTDGEYQFINLIPGNEYHLTVEYTDTQGKQYSDRAKPFTISP